MKHRRNAAMPLTAIAALCTVGDILHRDTESEIVCNAAE